MQRTTGESPPRLSSTIVICTARGVDTRVHHGVVDDVVHRAMGVPLFLFLDPCGLCLSREQLVD